MGKRLQTYVKSALSRRLALLEARQRNAARRMHIVLATDEDSRRRELLAHAMGSCA